MGPNADKSIVARVAAKTGSGTVTWRERGDRVCCSRCAWERRPVRRSVPRPSPFDGQYAGELRLVRSSRRLHAAAARGAVPADRSGGQVRFAYLPRFATILTGSVAPNGSFRPPPRQSAGSRGCPARSGAMRSARRSYRRAAGTISRRRTDGVREISKRPAIPPCAGLHRAGLHQAGLHQAGLHQESRRARRAENAGFYVEIRIGPPRGRPFNVVLHLAPCAIDGTIAAGSRIWPTTVRKRAQTWRKQHRRPGSRPER